MSTASRLIVVATDFSPLSQRAADYAAKLATSCEAQLCVVHVVEPIEHPATADEESRAFHAELLEKAQVKLDAEVERLGDPLIVRRVELGHRASTMVALVRALDPLMLVMGSSIQEWPTTHRVGTSLQFLVQAPCPVLFVP